MPEVRWIDNTSAVEVWRTLEPSSDVSSCGKTHKKVATKLKSKKTRENLSTILRRHLIECVELTYLSKEREPKLLIENQWFVFRFLNFFSTFLMIVLKSLCFLSKLRMCRHLQHLSDRSCDKLKSTSNSRCPFDSYIINIIQNTIFIIILHIIKINTIMFYYQQGDHKDEIITGQEFKSPLSPVQLSQVKCKLKPGPILSSVW